jgi:hypothetical protein
MFPKSISSSANKKKRGLKNQSDKEQLTHRCKKNTNRLVDPELGNRRGIFQERDGVSTLKRNGNIIYVQK